jgi:hypothetical protein
MLTSHDCQQTAPRLWPYLADELDAASHDEVRRHLLDCAHCYYELARIEDLCRLLRDIPGNEMPKHTGQRLENLLQSLEDGAGSIGPPSVRRPTCTQGWTPRSRG